MAFLRNFFKIAAWVGLGFFTVGVGIATHILIASASYHYGPHLPFGIVGWWLVAIFAVLAGLILMFLGGLIAQPGYFWIACISMGVLYIAVSVPPEWSVMVGRVNGQGIGGLLTDLRSYPVSPGLAAVLLGIILIALEKITKNRQKVAEQ